MLENLLLEERVVFSTLSHTSSLTKQNDLKTNNSEKSENPKGVMFTHEKHGVNATGNILGQRSNHVVGKVRELIVGDVQAAKGRQFA
jgi:hypothetical protein